MLYVNTLHAVLCISDIERSPSESSSTYLEAELVQNIFIEALPAFVLERQEYDSIYVFKDESELLSYNCIFHVKMYATKKDELC